MNRNERLIMRTMLAAAQAAGWELETLFDGGEDHEKLDDEAAIELANNLEQCHWNLMVPRERSHDGKAKRAWVLTIFGNGNDGLDVISDYTMNLDSFTDQVDQHTPRVRRPHGFMDEVEEFTRALELYVQGHDACYPEPSRLYAKRDRLELAAPAMYAALQDLVKVNGVRGPTEQDPEGDELLPADKQDPEVAAAMALLEKIGPQ